MIKKYEIRLRTAMWNFTISGVSFDFSPPRIINETNNCIFTRKEIDHYNRTFYRCFDYDGMKANLLVTSFKIIDNKEIIILDLPLTWKSELYDIFCNGITNETLKILTQKEEFIESFEKHPIKIIRRCMNYE